MRKANFMNYLTTNGTISGTNIRSTAQAALEARMRCREEIPLPLGPSMEEWESRWKVIKRVDKRANRGGMTMRPGDGIERD